MVLRTREQQLHMSEIRCQVLHFEHALVSFASKKQVHARRALIGIKD
jgi:hypothetical protein